MKMNPWGAAAAMATVFAAGAATTYLLTRPAPVEHRPATPDVEKPVSSVITLTPEQVQRLGISSEVIGTSATASALRLPGSVQPNAYRRVSVTPLVGGRVTRVFVTLGQAVKQGGVLAEVYSPEVAQARSAYMTARAEIEAGEARLRRTERLAELGSASRQELDDVRAEHVRHETELREATARLRLFGLEPSRMEHGAADDAGASVIRVTAPQSGVVIERQANAGMSVDASTPLVTIAELSPVWIIADVYERDLSRVAVGAPVTVTTDAYPDLQLHGRVNYVSPELRPDTRTAQVRIELPNANGRLRFGMFVTVDLGGTGAAGGLTAPKAAIQAVGPDSVVFVQQAGQTFEQRRVSVGQSASDRVPVLSGLAAGERIVTQGSFALRAEAERLGIRPAAGPPPARAGGTDGPIQIVTVEVTEKGFNVSTPTVKAGTPVRMTFTRKANGTCATDLAIPDHGIKRDLPFNTPVTVEFTPQKDVTFQCGMGMLSGTLMVR